MMDRAELTKVEDLPSNPYSVTITTDAEPVQAPRTDGVDLDDKWLGEKIPEDIAEICQPQLWNVLVKQVGIKKSIKLAGGFDLALPDQVVDDQVWTVGMCVVVLVGPAVYKGRRFEDLGVTPDMAPKPGDVYRFEARTPKRVVIDGETFIEVPDDGLTMKFGREQLARVKFRI